MTPRQYSPENNKTNPSSSSVFAYLTISKGPHYIWIMNLSIITVTYQSNEYIDQCILSIVTHILDPSYEHIIVDNGSTDGTIETIESGYLNYVRLIKNDRNLGFAAANNRALEEAKGRYILFLNPDMQIHKGWLDDLLAWMDAQEGIGIASCKLLNYLHEPHQHLRPWKFPRPSKGFLWSTIKPHFQSSSNYFYPSFDDDKTQEVEHVRGAFMLLKKETLQRLGIAIDPNYFILSEDVDLCKTISALGLKIVYWPHLCCIDYFSRSFILQPKPWKYLHMQRGWKIYLRKWHSPWHAFWFSLFMPITFLSRLPKWGLKSSYKALKEYREQVGNLKTR